MKEIKELLAITASLKEQFIQYNRNFTLDGRLVGDIGEVLAAEKYNLQLLPENTPIHDAIEISTGRKIQIKSSFKENFYFPFGEYRIPDYYLALIIRKDGNLEELYNGPGEFIYKNYIIANKLKGYKNSYYRLSHNKLKRLNQQISIEDKIKMK
ncbi:hypothetical protein SAMN05216480_12021 [Pustulibacterium marinum]|uniref:DUF6998 domain-containing protein n=1 Tax=Pustulibacterium marinum TaxID=1224947 RepID=A0A1I7IRJ0_9FLAO|nr:hypothetical protein [Pustulibacterium marinum]SFU75528.1 hypothetical protein SAMN05216480_12021 [Pustulibacterium marinum]